LTHSFIKIINSTYNNYPGFVRERKEIKTWRWYPTSPDYSKEAMSPFGKTSIKRKLGSVFSENNQYILSTLFYQFNVRLDMLMKI
jgi:hypothetical protein